MKPDAPIMLTPRQIAERYGISQPLLSRLCTVDNDAIRLPSVKIPGRNGRLGKRLVRVTDLENWLAKYADVKAETPKAT